MTPADARVAELIARLESAESGTYELDCAIGKAVGNPLQVPPAYTVSLDAALTLVPEGWILEKLSDSAMGPPGRLTAMGATAEIVNDAHSGPCTAQGQGETRALAVVIACLKARQ